ncbi:flagellar hook assembly protein FlgD [Terricaulis sp.]|jgi:flagellar basal-body rod modification protein FlgD|uniref:flagellar hook assembly protein FlgD n=1 Tax=Terricaulis sp. TaxID=2768686 RepID=UPI00378340E6
MAVSGIDVTATASEAATSRTRLSDNYDTFLVLLTAQLQNQDPLAPMDSTQFTQQLVQFSQVEQQIRTNEQLEGLAGQYQAAAAGAALSYLGKDAIIEADETYLAGGSANWAYRLPEAADSMKIQVKDMQGRVVYETTSAARGSGEHLFTWDGVKTNGETAADGVYQISISAQNAAGTAITPSVSVRETIMGVDFSGTTPVVITPSGTRELSTIRSVLENG